MRLRSRSGVVGDGVVGLPLVFVLFLRVGQRPEPAIPFRLEFVGDLADAVRARGIEVLPAPASLGIAEGPPAHGVEVQHAGCPVTGGAPEDLQRRVRGPRVAQVPLHREIGFAVDHRIDAAPQWAARGSRRRPPGGAGAAVGTPAGRWADASHRRADAPRASVRERRQRRRERVALVASDGQAGIVLRRADCSSPPSDGGALDGTRGAAVPPATAASGPTGSSVSRP
jgi:hypothetical protein